MPPAGNSFSWARQGNVGMKQNHSNYHHYHHHSKVEVLALILVMSRSRDFVLANSQTYQMH